MVPLLLPAQAAKGTMGGCRAQLASSERPSEGPPRWVRRGDSEASQNGDGEAVMAVSNGKPVLRVGFIGLGGAAAAMIGKFARNPGFKVAGAADVDPEILARFKQDYPDAEAYPKAEGLCESKNIDFIYIGTPNRFHKEHAVMALSGRKHTLVEKPMTVSIEEADAMVDAADRNGVLLGVNVKHS